MEGKYFIIEDGKVRITDMEKPTEPDEFKMQTAYSDGLDNYNPSFIIYREALTQFKQSGVEVGNMKYDYKDYLSIKENDGVVACPSGTTFEVNECCSHESCPVNGECEYCKEPKSLAFVTFNKI